MLNESVFIFSNKKATLITRQMLIHLGMLGLLVLTTIILFKYVKSVEEDTELQKLFLSRDLALLMNTLYSAPGDVTYTYSFDKLNLDNFNFEFMELNPDKPIVRVEDNSIKKSYPYGTILESKQTYSIAGTNSIKFSKSNSKIDIKNE